MSEEEKKVGALAKAAPTQLGAIDRKKAGAALQRSSDEDTISQGDKQYMSFSGKTGEWSIGREKTPVDPEAIYFSVPTGFREGWKFWRDGKPQKELMWPSHDPSKAVPESDLPEMGDYDATRGEGWAWSREMAFVDQDNPGAKIEMSFGSVTGNHLIAAIGSETGRILVEAPEEMADNDIPMVCVFTLAKEKFLAKGQWNFKLVHEVLGWCSFAEALAYFDDEDADLDEMLDGAEINPDPEPPKKKSRAKPKAKPKAEEPEEEDLPPAEEVEAEDVDPPKRPRRTRRKAA